MKNTYCTYKGERHKVLSFGRYDAEYMKEYFILNEFYVNTISPEFRFTRVPLVSCSDFVQLNEGE